MGRSNPNQAIQARYFTGPEQDALEVQDDALTRDGIEPDGAGSRSWPGSMALS